MGHAHRHRGHGAGHQKRDNNNPLNVVYVTAPADFEGEIGGYLTNIQDNTPTQTKEANVGVGAAVQATQTKQANVGVGGAVRASQTSSSQEETATQQANVQTTQQEQTQATSTKEQAQITTEAPLTTATAAATTKQTANTAANNIDENATNVPLTTFSTATSETGSDATATTPTLQNNAESNSGSSSSSNSSGSPSATPVSAGGSEALSGGAKAGIAIGAILGVGLVAVLIFFLVRKKKQGQKLEEEENEKVWGNHGSMPPGPTPLPPPPMPMVSEPEPKVSSTEPPQLNVRPITQFAPDLTPSQSSVLSLGAGGVGPGAGSSEGALRNLTGNTPPQTPQSSISNPNPFHDPVNPFGNQAEAASPIAPSAVPGPANTAAHSTPDLTHNDSAIGVAVAGAAVAGAAGGVAAASASKEKALPNRPESAQSRSPSPHVPTAPSPVSAISDDAVAAAPVVPTAGAAGPSPGPTNVHRVQLDFAPSMDDELDLRVGQLVRMLHEYDDGWALCIRLDRSQQGVVPRSCLSAAPVKPRTRPPPGAGPGPRGPPMGPNGRMVAAPGPGRFYPGDSRPMPPVHPGYTAPPQPQPYQPRPMPPAQFPAAPRSFSPGPSGRPMPPRCMSPGPYGPPGMQRPDMAPANRRRSNSAGGALRYGPPGPMMPPPSTQLPAIPNLSSNGQIPRKPVGNSYDF
ncbi:hypothetical protein ASPWEDRAFT_171952 [Aspergillus wentii DTO 134E9]|uniref:SH3 domain-containing protein n=1 Tax=Aspergillus wentii DTO 134E9 TaxID=1073089 RepID=A0A1L9RJP2_ASPWE|nr:uncharacterized protein ASPWEDRAFT_171952 [Aspergillus wentii DTO 134E9]KAI9931920.1 hypothetical protein MW887_009421 [Aspergillus wentii]OJJ35123.1 hypothetical protein ASPWEDRAFT_171952 [Aspergillus wentii DTO 134E9]